MRNLYQWLHFFNFALNVLIIYAVFCGIFDVLCLQKTSSVNKKPVVEESSESDCDETSATSSSTQIPISSINSIAPFSTVAVSMSSSSSIDAEIDTTSSIAADCGCGVDHAHKALSDLTVTDSAGLLDPCDKKTEVLENSQIEDVGWTIARKGKGGSRKKH